MIVNCIELGRPSVSEKQEQREPCEVRHHKPSRHQVGHPQSEPHRNRRAAGVAKKLDDLIKLAMRCGDVVSTRRGR